jgi:CRISPR-associated protein Csx17
MAELVLTGCRATPLSGYLSALGVHRAVSRLLDAGAEGRWHHERYGLTCRIATTRCLMSRRARSLIR